MSACPKCRKLFDCRCVSELLLEQKVSRASRDQVLLLPDGLTSVERQHLRHLRALRLRNRKDVVKKVGGSAVEAGVSVGKSAVWQLLLFIHVSVLLAAEVACAILLVRGLL